MNDRKYFVVPIQLKDMLLSMSNSQIGEVIKGMFSYVCEGKTNNLKDSVSNVAFLALKSINDEMIDRYNAKCEQNKRNIEKRWGKEKTEYERIRPNTNVYDPIRKDTNVYKINNNINRNKYKEKINKYRDTKVSCENSDEFSPEEDDAFCEDSDESSPSRPNLMIEEGDFDRVFGIWNDNRGGLNSIRKISGKGSSNNRKGKIVACMQFIHTITENGTKEEAFSLLENVIIKASASSFLSGKNKRGWKADFDWVMREDNILRIYEGQFDDQNKPQRSTNEGTHYEEF